MFRRGTILAEIKDYEMALKEFERALKFYPNDRSLIKKIKEVKDLMETQRKREAKKYAKMFG